jgi:uncharacterized protein (UPF0297 family)
MEAKEQFSDGVGYNWINQLIAYCASPDEQLVSWCNFRNRTIRQSLKRRIFTDPSLISTILKLVRHKPLGGFQNGKKIKIQAEEQMRRT